MIYVDLSVKWWKTFLLVEVFIFVVFNKVELIDVEDTLSQISIIVQNILTTVLYDYYILIFT